MSLILVAIATPGTPNYFSPAIKGFIHGALAVWPLWLLIGLAALAKLALELYRLRRLSMSGIAEIDRMDGRTFEIYLSTLFRRLGYSVEVTRYRGDYGADLVVSKTGRRTAVQAKRWRKRVGVKAVQEAVAAKGYYGCGAALVVANRDFTPQARLLARRNSVELWDRDVLVGKLLAVRGHPDAELPATAQTPRLPELLPAESTPGPKPATVPSARSVRLPDTMSTGSEARCEICGVVVSAKVRDYCLSRPNRFGGNIYCFKHQRILPQPQGG